MNPIIRETIALTALVFLFGCGGGGGGADSGGIGGTGVVSSGVMIKGSVILNGVRFDDSNANIVIDDTPKTAANLQSGMVVRVQGEVDASGRNGTAKQVEAQIEVRGIVTSVNASGNPPSLLVLGQNVLIDDLTILSGITEPISSALDGTLVEIYGLRDSTGAIRATRIEANRGQMGDEPVDEIRGVVSGGAGTSPNAFDLGTQPIVLAPGAVIVPAGATYANGSVVEVHCTSRPSCVNAGGQFVASRIEVEDAEDTSLQPGQGQKYEVEGLVSGYSLPADNDFFVAGVRVTTSGSTEFEGGQSTDMADNIKVEAEGVWDGTTLVARKIDFTRSVVRLQGVVIASASGAFTLDVAGRFVSVVTDDFTDGNVPPVNATDCVQVRGQRRAGGATVVTAGEIRIDNCSNSDRPVLQAPVEAESGTILTLLGFPINVGAPTDSPPYADLNDQPLSQTQFFAAVTPSTPGPPPDAGTLVKIIFELGTNAVRQVELED